MVSGKCGTSRKLSDTFAGPHRLLHPIEGDQDRRTLAQCPSARKRSGPDGEARLQGRRGGPCGGREPRQSFHIPSNDAAMGSGSLDGGEVDVELGGKAAGQRRCKDSFCVVLMGRCNWRAAAAAEGVRFDFFALEWLRRRRGFGHCRRERLERRRRWSPPAPSVWRSAH